MYEGSRYSFAKRSRSHLFDLIDAMYVTKFDSLLLERLELRLAWYCLHQTGVLQKNGKNDQDNYRTGLE